MDYAIVAIGGSAGSLAPLQYIVHDLPETIRAAIFVVTHVPPDSVSAMPHILSRSGPLFATHAIDGAPIAPGRIVVAPPNYHLSIEGHVMRVVCGARENGQRPSIDVLFRSAATAFGSLACGVLLSGTLDDGVAGLQAIRKAGGEAIVQEPSDAIFGDMPRNAINADAADLAVPAEELAPAIVACVESALRLGRLPTGGAPARDERQVGRPSFFTCPECGGVLFEAQEAAGLRFRCHTGHAYNVNSILSAQKTGLEGSLWAALRILQERVKLLERMAQRAQERGDMRSAERFLHQVQELRNQQTTIRGTLTDVVAQNPPSAS